MPRYGLISERRNRLHEVIRLSGTAIQAGERTETLKVKVASIPGIRLQVYFMDNAHFFKRKGVHADQEGKTFEDNGQRALFFASSVFETISKLGWTPDVVHSFGWMGSLAPLLLQTKYADNPIFAKAKSMHTPGHISADETVVADFHTMLPAPPEGSLEGLTVSEIGLRYADQVVAPPNFASDSPMERLVDDPVAMCEQTLALYDQVLNEVAV